MTAVTVGDSEPDYNVLQSHLLWATTGAAVTGYGGGGSVEGCAQWVVKVQIDGYKLEGLKAGF